MQGGPHVVMAICLSVLPVLLYVVSYFIVFTVVIGSIIYSWSPLFCDACTAVFRSFTIHDVDYVTCENAVVYCCCLV